MKRFLAFLLVSTLLVSTAAAQSTIFLVRHAEKAAAGGDDPDLSDSGRARAESLAKVLQDASLSAIYTTELKRTRQTAAPLAKSLNLEATVIPAKDQAALVGKLQGSSGNILVVGHSNTLPDIIKALGVATSVKIADNDYDNLFVLILDAKPRLIVLHFR
jgi:broad specificity phosphatase PhoE